MIRAEILDEAKAATTAARHEQHGDAQSTLTAIAAHWTLYLQNRNGEALTGSDVASMMALLKMARSQSGAVNRDDYVDGAGYLALAGELALERAE